MNPKLREPFVIAGMVILIIAYLVFNAAGRVANYFV